MDVSVGCGVVPASEQVSRDMEVIAFHDGVRGVGMAQVMEPRVLHDSCHIARLGPEPVERPIGQRLVPAFAGECPLLGSRVGVAGKQLAPPRPTERALARSWGQSGRAGQA